MNVQFQKQTHRKCKSCVLQTSPGPKSKSVELTIRDENVEVETILALLRDWRPEQLGRQSVVVRVAGLRTGGRRSGRDAFFAPRGQRLGLGRRESQRFDGRLGERDGQVERALLRARDGHFDAGHGALAGHRHRRGLSRPRAQPRPQQHQHQGSHEHFTTD